MANKEIAGIGVGSILTTVGLILISPLVDGWNWIGLAVLLVGLIGFGGFVKGKWY